jgi:putative spermidine/putrescine transport system permease protein
VLPVGLAALGALFLIAPILVVVPMSFSTAISFAFPPPGYWLGYYAKYFSSEEWLEPTLNSLAIALGATALTMLIVVPAAFGYVRYRFRGKTLVN